MGLEDANHMILQCPFTNEIRREMFTEINSMPNGIGKQIVDSSHDILATLLGKYNDDIDTQNMFDFWKITCTGVYKMYRMCTKGRNRIV